MKLKEIGEFGFIERQKPLFNHLIPDRVISIGDDCAIIPANENEDWLVTTDLLMEDVHFLRNIITPEQLGYKSLAVNLSDIASMGGTPIGSFLSIAIPADIEVEYLDGFMKGYHTISEKYNTPLLGGDTTKSLKHLAINVCVIGKCQKEQARQRKMARPGDLICTTGPLGDSAGGLLAILEQISVTADVNYLIDKHHQPEPCMNEGKFLAQQKGVHAMMDISDGIASDLLHILKASGTNARIDMEKLPLSEPLKRLCLLHNWDCEELATCGGEDYELLFTLAPESLKELQLSFHNRFGKKVYPIGNIVKGIPEIQWYRNKERVTLTKTGFNHFKK